MRQPSMQSGSAREQRKAAGSSAGEQGRAGQGNRARQQGSRAGQGSRAARQQGRAASEIQFANGRRGANICQKIC